MRRSPRYLLTLRHDSEEAEHHARQQGNTLPADEMTSAIDTTTDSAAFGTTQA